MPPTEFSLRLQHGITGGFAPPTPDAIHTITLSAHNPSSLFIQSAVRPPGQPTLQQPLAPKSLALSSSAPSNTEALLDELHAILKDLPTEQPPGSEDIYGLDTSIAWGSADLEWCNGGPQGCGGGHSEVQPTDEQKAKFRRAVDIVNQLVGEAK
ncbi:hypothetical protein GLOTRDRAFT_82427 [Gloeophyllum trabeum ATCC 11539]|uniref:Uncharacterized protein n=1 Tax=Gloeophyllum trabeum (strain ATCC 11539 / FP-39264 / Madison 617) TaxID=670483 RepID=S7PSE2_GLOTA|nr:uncharacterized protein GLOTRDRAFT_82427 [Gloeophyllum trabeum ATCC 11539]EPQ50307.1 hypothetical protein GLOTRDRAFT_82427 [Gloeophyllum trabeum ATCC 11539]